MFNRQLNSKLLLEQYSFFLFWPSATGKYSLIQQHLADQVPVFDLQHYLQYGGLPPVWLSLSPEEALHADTNTYLKDEIQAEALVRNLPAFSKFLQLAALTSITVLNFSAISNEVGISVSTILEYYHILEDTFLGFLVPSWQKSVKRKPIATAKVYFLDTGVSNALVHNYAIPDKIELFGNAFEYFIAMELRAYLIYTRKRLPLQFWQTKHGHEVDFIIGDEVAIEVKSATSLNKTHMKSLKMLQEEGVCKKYFLVSRDKLLRQTDGVMCLHWQEFLIRLWQGKLL